METREEAHEKQVFKWYSQGKYQKIIKAVEKMNPRKRSTAMDALLAHAYSVTSQGWKDRKLNLMAVTLLKNLERDFEETKHQFLHNLWLGDAYFLLDQFNSALSYYLKAKEIDSTSKSAQNLNEKIGSASKRRIVPLFTEPFKERVERAWQEFEKREIEFRNILDKDPEGKRKAEIQQKLLPILRIAFNSQKGQTVNLKKSRSRYLIEFNGYSNKAFSPMWPFEAEYFKGHCPASVRQYWDINVGTQPIRTASEHLKELLKKIKIWIRKERSGLFSFEIFPEIDLGILTRNPTNNQDVFTISVILGTLIGEVCLVKFLRLSKILEETRYEPYLTLADLPDYLKHHNIDTEADVGTLLNQEIHFSRSIPNNTENFDFREDIVSGTSKFVKLLLQFEQGSDEAVNQLEGDGIFVGSLYFKKDYFKGENQEQDINNFKEKIKNFFIENADEDGFEFFGEAHGKIYEYIDVIVWNSTAFSKAIFKFAELEIKPVLIFQSFFKTAQGMILENPKNKDITTEELLKILDSLKELKQL